MKTYEEQTFTDLMDDGLKLADTDFIDCQFANCQIEGAQLKNVRFLECTFDHCTIVNPALTFSVARNLQITSCNLIGINWADLVANKYALVVDRLTDSLLKYNNFIGLDLPHFSFANNEILNSSFEECDLNGASFAGCGLTGTQFLGNNLKHADFSNAHGYFIDLHSNQLQKAAFTFPDAMSLLDSLDIKLN